LSYERTNQQYTAVRVFTARRGQHGTAGERAGGPDPARINWPPFVAHSLKGRSRRALGGGFRAGTGGATDGGRQACHVSWSMRSL